MTEDERRLNRRLDDLERDLANVVPDNGSGSVTYLARTKKVATYPATASVYYAVDMVYLTGTEAEGAAGVVASMNGPTQYAYNVGPAVPYEGQLVEVTRVAEGRWEFRQEPGDGGLLVTPNESPSTSLNVAVSAGYFLTAAGVFTYYAGTAGSPLTLAASATNRVYLTDAGVLSSTTGSYPAGSVRLATVLTGTASVTKVVTDDRTFRTACLET